MPDLDREALEAAYEAAYSGSADRFIESAIAAYIEKAGMVTKAEHGLALVELQNLEGAVEGIPSLKAELSEARFELVEARAEVKQLQEALEAARTAKLLDALKKLELAESRAALDERTDPE